MNTRLRIRSQQRLDLQLTSAQQSRADSIRGNIVHGLTLCAVSRTEMRAGSVVRADQVLVKAKKVAAQVSRELMEQMELSIPEQRHLYLFLDRLTSRIESLDPLWTLCSPADLRQRNPLARVA